MTFGARAAISRAIRDDHPGAASAESARFFEEAKLVASDGAASDELGTSVAVSGDTVVVGVAGTNGSSERTRGAAYVFVKPARGWGSTPALQAKLTASDGAPFDGFGWSVAISGDTVVVGSPFTTIGSNPSQGAAYVFVKPASGWATTSAFAAKLTSSDGARISFLGLSVTISGGTVVAGAPGAMIGSYYAQGAAYVFVKPQGAWSSSTETARLTASDGIPGDNLGASISVSGDTIVAGTASVKEGLNPGLNSAYVFVKPLAGWVTTSHFDAKLRNSDGVVGDAFGASVATTGDTVVVGAPRSSVVFKGDEEGAAYVFVEPVAGWESSAEAARLTPADGGVLDDFGTSVGIFGDTVVIGALQSMVTGEPSTARFSSEPGADYLNSGLGVAYVFVKPSSGWSTTSQFDSRLSADDGLATSSGHGNGFGSALGISADTLIVGAPIGDVGANSYQGAAYVFQRCPSAIPPGRTPCIQSLEPTSPAPIKGRTP